MLYATLYIVFFPHYYVVLRHDDAIGKVCTGVAAFYSSQVQSGRLKTEDAEREHEQIFNEIEINEIV